MYRSFSEFIDEIKSSGWDWVKSQVKLSAITFLLLTVGLFVADLICENKYGTGLAWDALIPVIALIIAIIDAVPVLGISACMLPWAFFAAIFADKKIGGAILLVFVIVMIIKQILEPFIRGKSLGVSPLEEVIAAVIGWTVFPGTVGSAIGLIVVPIAYTVGKKAYMKINPNAFANKKTSFFEKKQQENNVVDITDDIVDVDDDK